MSSYPKLPTRFRDVPKPVSSGLAKPARIVPLGDGRARVLIGGIPCGVYASEAAAKDGLAVFKRLGVAS